MKKLLPELKSVSAIALGMVSVSAFMLLATFLIMPESLPHTAAQWFFVLAGGTAGILVAGTATLHVFAGWQEEESADKSKGMSSNHDTLGRANGSPVRSNDSGRFARSHRQPVRE